MQEAIPAEVMLEGNAHKNEKTGLKKRLSVDLKKRTKTTLACLSGVYSTMNRGAHRQNTKKEERAAQKEHEKKLREKNAYVVIYVHPFLKN